ncbi:MAG: glycosyltransferase [Polyangia bacterium]|nr:glycosyltransferase [Polyangia bacterium]
MRWAGLEVYRGPYQFQDVVEFNQHTPAMMPRVALAKLDALVESARGFDVVLCETPEALLLGAEWGRRGLPRTAILALEVEGLLRVNALRRWYLKAGAQDPWPMLLGSGGISFLAASEQGRTVLLGAGVPEASIFPVRGCTAHFEMTSGEIEAQLAGGSETDEELARGLPRDGVLLPGGGRRDLVTMLRAVQMLPELPFYLVDELLPRKQHQLRKARVPRLENLFWLKPLPLRRFVSLVRRARIVVVGLEAGAGDGGHTTVATAHRMGVPVVTSDVPGILDYVKGGVDAVLVPPEDPAAMAEAIRSLWEDPRRRTSLAEKGRESERVRCEQATAQLREAVDAAIHGLRVGVS